MDSTKSGARIVRAKVPLSMLFGYVTDLRTITSGRATSSMEFSHYSEVSTAIAKGIVEEHKGRPELLKSVFNTLRVVPRLANDS